MLNSSLRLKLQSLKSSIEELANDYEHASSTSDPKPISGYITTKQAAVFLNITTRTLYNYRQSGLLFYQIGRKLLYNEADLTAFVQKFGVTR